MSFSSEEEMQHRKMNFFSTHDVIEKHNNKPGVTFKLEHNRFSTMVWLNIEVEKKYNTVQ